eukprot:6191070-Pleurochrysis_carterae.AAC.1
MPTSLLLALCSHPAPPSSRALRRCACATLPPKVVKSHTEGCTVSIDGCVAHVAASAARRRRAAYA